MVYGDEKRRDSSGCCNRLLFEIMRVMCARLERAPNSSDPNFTAPNFTAQLAMSLKYCNNTAQKRL